MTILQADGTTGVTLHGPGQQNTRQTAALRGPASTANNKGKGRRKPNTGRRPKNVNAARRNAPRTKLKRFTCQRVKGQCLWKNTPEDPVLHPAPLQIGIIHQLRGSAVPPGLSEAHGPTLTHPVSPDLEGGPGRFQDPEAFRGLEVGLCPAPNLGPILDHVLDPGQDQDPGLHPEGEVCPDPQERGNPARPKHTP